MLPEYMASAAAAGTPDDEIRGEDLYGDRLHNGERGVCAVTEARQRVQHKGGGG